MLVGGNIYDKWVVWHRHRDQFLEALSHCKGTHNEDDVLILLASGKYQLWDAGNAAAITFTFEYPRFKVVNTLLVAGEMSGLEALEPVVHAWAIEQQCKRAYYGGRKGWQRKADTTSVGEVYFKEL